MSAIVEIKGAARPSDASFSPPEQWPKGDRAGAVRIPPEWLYWTVADGIPSHRRRRDPREIGYRLEASIPQPIEEVEYCWTAAPGSRSFIICGVDRAQLRSWIDALESDGTPVSSLAPSALPDFIEGSFDLHPGQRVALTERLELRRGELEPGSRRRRRLCQRLSFAASLLLSAGLIIWGMAQRAHSERDMASQIRAQTSSLIVSALPTIPGTASTADPRLRLEAELRRLQQTRDSSAQALVAEDRVATLLALLSAWPDEIPTLVNQLELRAEAITIRGELRSADDYESLRLALGDLEGEWKAPTGNTSRRMNGYTFGLALQRQGAERDQGGTQ